VTVEISVWKNQIIIKSPLLGFGFDEKGKMLEHSLLEMGPDKKPIFKKGNPLRGHATHSQRLDAFICFFSKQNLQRIRAQFGSDIAVNQGHGRIEYLKAQNTKFHTMLENAVKAKTCDASLLPDLEYKMPPLGEYQHRGVLYLCCIPKAPFFADCGVGKTFAVLTSTEQQIKDGIIEPGQTLVCGKLNTLETGWEEDAKKFTDLKAVTVWTGSNYKRKEKLKALLDEPADIYLINHEGVRVLEKELTAKKFKKVVVDESTVLKSFKGASFRGKGGAFGKSLMKVAAEAEWRVVMSGTPAPNGTEDLWGQMHFLDPEGFLLESSWKDFKQRWMNTIYFCRKNPDGSPFIPEAKEGEKQMNIREIPQKHVVPLECSREISQIVNPLIYRVKIRDHIHDLPERTVMKRSLPMVKDQLKHYKKMKKDLYTIIHDETISVSMKLTQAMKLRQITGGFIIDDGDVAHPLNTNPKLDMLDSLIEEEIDKKDKVVIYAQYRWEIELIESRYKHFKCVSVYGGNKAKDNLKNIKDFIENPDVRLIVLHPKSAAHGITFTMAHYMVFYSISYSAEDDYQCIKRIERAGQKNAMFIYYLLCKDSIDEPIFSTIQAKAQNQEELIDQKTVDAELIAQLMRHI